MMSTIGKHALARQLERGEYVVDTQAVAEAMLARGAHFSGVLVPAQSLDGSTLAVEQDEPGAGDDLA